MGVVPIPIFLVYSNLKGETIVKQGKNLKALATELKRQHNEKRDFIINAHNLQIQTNSKGESTLTFNLNNKPITFGVNDNTHQQIASRLNIPIRYYQKMQLESPQLLDQTVNDNFKKVAENRMIRTLDGTARAFLSDRYRRIDNLEICAAVYPFIESAKSLSVESAEVTDSHLYLKVVNKRIKAEISKGNIIQGGFVISNSEVGAGCLKIEPLIFNSVSKNTLIFKDCLHKTNHIGRQFKSSISCEIPADERNYNVTILTKLQKDIQSAVSDSATFDTIIQLLKQVKQIPLQKNIVKAVESLANDFSLSPNERGDILRQLCISEDYSRYGLIQAISAASKISNSYERATELEHIGGDLLYLSSTNNILAIPQNRSKLSA